MSETIDTIPADILVSRDEPERELREALAHVIREENRRWWWDLSKAVLPLGLAALSSAYAIGMGLVVWSRPVPKDHFMVSLVHADGTYEAPVEVNDLPKSKKEDLIRYTTINFVRAYESYAWAANQANYKLVSILTSGEPLQKQYQDRFLKPGPDNLDTKYGQNIARSVAAISATPKKGSPDAVDIVFVERIVDQHGKATCQRWRGQATFRDSENIPPAVRQAYDPASVIFRTYESSVDPLSPARWDCGA